MALRLCSVRELQQPMGAKPEELLEQNRYLSPKSLVNAIYHSDRTLQEWTVSRNGCLKRPDQTERTS